MNDTSCILIVDDEEHAREAVKMLLISENYELAFACNGTEAMKQAVNLIPDLILLDISMPDIDGFEVCKLLRVHAQLAEVPIIMLTALDDRESRLHGIQVGADDFISKPYDRLELRLRVATIIRLNRYRHLLTQRSRLDWVIEHSQEGYLLLQDNDIITYANQIACHYLGLPKVGGLTKSFQEYVNKEYRRVPPEAWNNWPLPNTVSRYLVSQEIHHGVPFWLAVTTAELPSDRFSERLIHLRDVSHIMNLEQQIWTFHSLISHKLRSPLNGLASLQLLETATTNWSQEDKMLMEIAQRNAHQLESQILEILSYLDNAHLGQQTPKQFNIHELPQLVHQINRDLQICHIHVTVASNLAQVFLQLSEKSLELILRELLNNAQKFHPQHSPVVDIKATLATPTMVKLTVQDDGLHVSSAELMKAWSPYYQSERYFTGEVEGLGLGLSMVARLVWNHKGRCDLYNRQDKAGIVVEIVLPCVKNDYHHNLV